MNELSTRNVLAATLILWRAPGGRAWGRRVPRRKICPPAPLLELCRAYGQEEGRRSSSLRLAAGQRPSLFKGEFVSGDGVIAVAGVQDHGREFRMIGGIGKMLRFQAEAGALRIGSAALANSVAVAKVATLKLHASLSPPNFPYAAGPR